MLGKFMVIVLDGFGIGYMKDVSIVRPQDMGSNTCKHILERTPDLKLKTLEKLGLMNALGEEIGLMKFSKGATFGKSELTHFGADTFFGHQEIMGTKPMKPLREPFSKYIEEVYKLLKKEGYDVEYIGGKEARILMVNGALTVADNIETDLGQAVNVTASLELIPFSEVLKVGKLVRSIVMVPRVITFGGEDITKEDILNAIEEKPNGFIGVNAPKSGVYNKGYQCRHLGYGVDPNVQVPTILSEVSIDVTLLGKVADVVINEKGKSISWVDTAEVLQLTLDEMDKMDTGFICTNVQETDLSGHAENVERYAEKLSIADKYIEKIIEKLKADDILLIMADHGNDPTVGHSKHTRECVPLLIYGKNVKTANIGIRKTLSDVGATVADYLKVGRPQNGESFLDLIR